MLYLSLLLFTPATSIAVAAVLRRILGIALVFFIFSLNVFAQDNTQLCKIYNTIHINRSIADVKAALGNQYASNLKEIGSTYSWNASGSTMQITFLNNGRFVSIENASNGTNNPPSPNETQVYQLVKTGGLTLSKIQQLMGPGKLSGVYYEFTYNGVDITFTANTNSSESNEIINGVSISNQGNMNCNKQ